jgi:hypothetical protein
VTAAIGESDRFVESLCLPLVLHTAAAALPIAGGNVKHLALALEPWGFAGEVTFWIEVAPDDAIHPAVIDPAPLELEITVAKARYLGTVPEPIRVRGAVTWRAVTEVAGNDVGGSPILYRRYRLGFVDRARAAWSEHRPTAVYVDRSLASILGEHLVAGVTVEATWPELTRKRPLVCLGLGEDDASFHDLIVWLAATRGGHLGIDYASGGYWLAARKPAPTAAVDLGLDLVGELEVALAEPVRHAINLVNSHAAAAAITAVEQPHARAPLRRDHLVYTPLAAEVDARAGLEARRARIGLAELAIRCRSFPEVLLVPGAGARLDPDAWSPNLLGYGAALRLVSLHLDARAEDESAEHDLDLDATGYRCALALRLEQEGDPRPRLPAYRTPRYPIVVEGTVVSPAGSAGDRAYTIYEDAATSRDHYRVKLPSWNVVVDVPFTPRFQPGHMYFPAYKDARVMVALGLESASIDSFVDWGPSVRLPGASQGNHILFGKNATSETSLRHWYVDSKPEVELRRVHAGDTGVVVVKDGIIVIETFEDAAAGGAAATVSLQPDAALATAQTEAKGEIALSDLDGAVEELGASLGGSAEAAGAAVKGEIGGAEAEVAAGIGENETALAALRGQATMPGIRVDNAIADARQRLRNLFDEEA